MISNLNKMAYLATFSCVAGLAVAGCGQDDGSIALVRDGNFGFESNKTVAQVFESRDFTKQGEWTTEKSSESKTPLVVYTSTIPNALIADIALTDYPNEVKEEIVKNLDKAKFKLQTEYKFAIDENKSFDAVGAQLIFNGKHVEADNDAMDMVWNALTGEGEVAQMQVSKEISTAFRYAVAKVMFPMSIEDGGAYLTTMDYNDDLFKNSGPIKRDEIEFSYAPLAAYQLINAEGNESKHEYELVLNTRILDVNEMRLNEVGKTIFIDGYGIYDGTELKDSNDLIDLIEPYAFESLFNKNEKFKGSVAAQVDHKTDLAHMLEVPSLFKSGKSTLQVDFSVFPFDTFVITDYSDCTELKNFLEQQQLLINYSNKTAKVAYAAAERAPSSKQGEMFVKALLSERNKLLEQDGHHAPAKLKLDK